MYKPINQKLRAMPQRIELSRMVADRYLSGDTGYKMKREKVAPGWLIEAVKVDMIDQGLIESKAKEKTYKFKPRQLDRCRILRRMDIINYDFRSVG